MPREADWVWILSRGPIRAADPITTLLVEGRRASWPLGVKADTLRGWDGYELNLFGCAVAPTEEPGWPQWVLSVGDKDVAIQIWRLRAHLPNAAAFAELRWPADVGVWPAAVGVSKRIHLAAGWEGLTPAEQDRAVTGAAGAMRAIHGLVSQRGKKAGDGQLWPGGPEEFLEDLWAAVERHTASTGRRRPKITGTRGESFRAMMQRRPAERTLRDWLGKVGLRPRDVESGKVTRANYSQFVAEQRPYSGR